MDDALIDAVKLFQDKNPYEEGCVDESVVKAAKLLWPSEAIQAMYDELVESANEQGDDA